MKIFIQITFLTTFITLVSSCKKNEGPGGSSSIIGVLSTNLYNVSDSLIDTYPKANEDLFIIYGDGKSGYNDKITTSYDGSFKFDYLEKGKYTIYFYEDCATCPEGKQAKIIASEITKNKSTNDLGSVGVKKISNKGTSTINGTILVDNYNSTGVYVNSGIGADIDVYIIYGNSNLNYSDRIKSNYDGTFSFPNLANGPYTIYAYSKSLITADGLDVVKVTAVIDTKNTVSNVGNITINQ